MDADPCRLLHYTFGFQGVQVFDTLESVVLAFDTRDLRTLCEKGAIAKDRLGADLAQALQLRLLDLRAATSVSDLVAAGLVEIQGNGNQSIELQDGSHLVFRANHPKSPVTPSGDIDWTRVRRIKLIGIEASNGQ